MWPRTAVVLFGFGAVVDAAVFRRHSQDLSLFQNVADDDQVHEDQTVQREVTSHKAAAEAKAREIALDEAKLHDLEQRIEAQTRSATGGTTELQAQVLAKSKTLARQAAAARASAATFEKQAEELDEKIAAERAQEDKFAGIAKDFAQKAQEQPDQAQAFTARVQEAEGTVQAIDEQAQGDKETADGDREQADDMNKEAADDDKVAKQALAEAQALASQLSLDAEKMSRSSEVASQEEELKKKVKELKKDEASEEATAERLIAVSKAQDARVQEATPVPTTTLQPTTTMQPMLVEQQTSTQAPVLIAATTPTAAPAAPEEVNHTTAADAAQSPVLPSKPTAPHTSNVSKPIAVAAAKKGKEKVVKKVAHKKTASQKKYAKSKGVYQVSKDMMDGQQDAEDYDEGEDVYEDDEGDEGEYDDDEEVHREALVSKHSTSSKQQPAKAVAKAVSSKSQQQVTSAKQGPKKAHQSMLQVRRGGRAHKKHSHRHRHARREDEEDDEEEGREEEGEADEEMEDEDEDDEHENGPPFDDEDDE